MVYLLEDNIDDVTITCEMMEYIYPSGVFIEGTDKPEAQFNSCINQTIQAGTILSPP